ncbi:hypothetical protein HMPREF3151_08695 [Corynebacterium sp. HMSC05H05]|uniref:hypothetical protein n=1 Tax=unclassified Corynebacterium TaxID=2624378 RepID=UPI0008A1587F|nr:MULTISPECIES: hypothetical protein [unclassified Corynebacterium]OFT57040.1 hypothetical protein HMPREF3151_08695 [Corynebacterium sp. HMSC05H05]OHR22481.1 hypothetical protein HMPREF2791_06065 [Corynebacterium sp. HMSC034A01]
MNKPLIIRFALVAVVVAIYLVASEAGWYPKLAGPLAVLAVAAVMFWPRRGGPKGPSRRELLDDIRSESRK